MNGEKVRISKDAVVAYYKVNPSIDVAILRTITTVTG
jgi:hypothetical protein